MVLESRHPGRGIGRIAGQYLVGTHDPVFHLVNPHQPTKLAGLMRFPFANDFGISRSDALNGSLKSPQIPEEKIKSAKVGSGRLWRSPSHVLLKIRALRAHYERLRFEGTASNELIDNKLSGGRHCGARAAR
jgi:hypothetical protein